VNIGQKIKIILLGGLVISAVWGGINIFQGAKNKFNPFSYSGKISSVSINGATVEVILADSQEKRQNGLTEYASIPQDQGMLFIYDSKSKLVFWSKNMKFSYDIIWITDQKVVGIEPKIPIPTNNQNSKYSPKENVNMVLEVNAGWSAYHKIKVGDKVEYK
jgi:hypothetical protein